MAGKFTLEVRRTLIAALEMGNYYETACKLSGVSYSTFRKWLVKGEEDEDSEYGKFRLEVEKAVARSESGHVAIIAAAAAEGDHKASLEFLSRRFPNRWATSNRVLVEVEKHLEGILDFLETKLAKDAYEEVILALADYDGVGKSNDG